jgi:hypothetical protein
MPSIDKNQAEEKLLHYINICRIVKNKEVTDIREVEHRDKGISNIGFKLPADTESYNYFSTAPEGADALAVEKPNVAKLTKSGIIQNASPTVYLAQPHPVGSGETSYLDITPNYFRYNKIGQRMIIPNGRDYEVNLDDGSSKGSSFITADNDRIIES